MIQIITYTTRTLEEINEVLRDLKGEARILSLEQVEFKA